MNGIRVSVIMPVHNYGAYIGDALRSVAAQTLHEFECIVVDDASTDNTAAVVEALIQGDLRFRLVRLERNQGVAGARNRALAEARGRYIQFLDADDLLPPRKLEIHATHLDTHPEDTVVYSDHYRFINPGAPLPQSGLAPNEKITGGGQGVVARLLRSNVFRMNAVLVRRDAVNAIGPFHPEFRYIEDWDLWLRMAASNRGFHYLDDAECTVGVRDTPGSLSKDAPAMRTFYLPVLQRLWVHGGLGPLNALSVLVRYSLTLLDRVVLRKGPVVVLTEGRWTFMPMALLVTVVMVPLWPLYKLYRTLRS
jgi:glycosyltransferase involved in cell wall biosynthesis